IRGCSFHGSVTLGRFSGRAVVDQGVALPTGIYNSTLADCVVGHDALIRDVRLLARYVVSEQAVLFNCGMIVCGDATCCGNGAVIQVGPQARGRHVPVFAELDIEIAAAVARPHECPDLSEQFARVVAAYARRAISTWGVIGPGAVAVNVGRIEGTYLGAGCRLDGASAVADSTLLGGPDEPAPVGPGACGTGCGLQRGAEVGPAAVVERSVLMAHASAGRHAKVSDSLVGPNSALAIGEVTSCLLGPFVGAHHQSLLISLIWPGGRGNVAHG